MMELENPSTAVSATPGGAILPSDGRERGKRCFKEVLLAGSTKQEAEKGTKYEEYEEGGETDMAMSPSSVQDVEHRPFCFSAAPGKKQKTHVSEASSSTFGHFDMGWVREDLEQICLDSISLGTGKDSLDIQMDSKPLLDEMQRFQNNGIILYFMGKILKGVQLKAWGDAVGGINSFSQFMFLGKGFYLGLCKDKQLKYRLLEQGGVWGQGFFALMLPWHDSFDPLGAFLQFFPVWLTFKALPPSLIPHVAYVASKIGKVLYAPPIGSYVCSRNITVCLLWDLKKKIPRVLKLELGMQNPLVIEVAVHSFPTACYRCKSVGHYAKQCPNVGEARPPPTDSPQKQEARVDKEFQQQDGVNDSIPLLKIEALPSQERLPDALRARGELLRKDITLTEGGHAKVLISQTSDQQGEVKFDGEEGGGRKKKKKQKKRKANLPTENKENELEGVEECTEIVGKSKKLPELKGTCKKPLKDSTNRWEEDEMSEETDALLDEKAIEQLSRVHKELHQYYNPRRHFFDLPASLIFSANGDRYFLFEDGQKIEEDFFLRQNNISSNDIRLISVKKFK